MRGTCTRWPRRGGRSGCRPPPPAASPRPVRIRRRRTTVCRRPAPARPGAGTTQRCWCWPASARTPAQWPRTPGPPPGAAGMVHSLETMRHGDRNRRVDVDLLDVRRVVAVAHFDPVRTGGERQLDHRWRDAGWLVVDQNFTPGLDLEYHGT